MLQIIKGDEMDNKSQFYTKVYLLLQPKLLYVDLYSSIR